MQLPPAARAIGCGEYDERLHDICWLCSQSEGWNGYRYTRISNKRLGLCVRCIEELSE